MRVAAGAGRTGRVGDVGRVQGGGALVADLLGSAVVNGGGGVQPGPGVAVLVVVVTGEGLAGRSRVGERPEGVGEVGGAFQGLEGRFEVGVVVAASPGRRRRMPSRA